MDGLSRGGAGNSTLDMGSFLQSQKLMSYVVAGLRAGGHSVPPTRYSVFYCFVFVKQTRRVSHF